MNKIIVELKDKNELESFENYLNQKGIVFKTEDEYEFEKQNNLMKIFKELVLQAPRIDISEKEIDQIVEEVRTKRYEKNRS